MNLADAKTQLEALPGVYLAHIRSVSDGPNGKHVHFDIHCASRGLLPEEAQRGIQEIQDALESDQDCLVSFTVSAGLRMPD